MSGSQPEPVEYVRAPREPSEATVQRAIKHMLNASIGVDYRWPHYARDLYRIMVAEAQPEPVADAGGVVERAIKDLQRRFPSWSPTPLMLGYARAVGAEVARSLLAQVESLKAEREELRDALATEREAKARMVEAAQALADDYQTSPRHHPNHVLVPLAAFEALRAALQGGEHDVG